jgi:hypothetical protein
MAEVNEAFAKCWQAAGLHLQEQGQGSLNWLRAHLNPPFLEHLSFRIGNQLFFVRVEDAEDQVVGPASLEGLLSIADGCKGHACVMPMMKRGDEWRCAVSGWGLLDARTEKVINPVALVTDEKITMTDWELQDLAVQVVRDDLEKSGKKLMSWQGNPSVDPSLWFVGDNGPEWVVIRAARWPENDVSIPNNINKIALECSPKSKTGHYAVVRATNKNDPFDPQAKENGNFIPLVRGEGITVGYRGLQPLPVFDTEPVYVPDDIGRQLVTELIGWFEKLLETQTVLPKVFMGVNAQGRQFIVMMGDLGLENREHLDFMRYVLYKEQAVAFAYKMRNAVEVCSEPQILQEQHTFYSGQVGKYIAVDLTSQATDSWSDGIKIIRRSSSEKPEIFLQDLLTNPFVPSELDPKYEALWLGIRDKVQWRERQWKSAEEKGPFDFAQEVFANILPFPFQDKHLNNRELSEQLELQDSTSAAKFQVVCICFVLFLIKRSLREALVVKFGSSFDDVLDFNKLALAADDLADSMIAQQLKISDLPSYFDLEYFQRWDRRYHEAARDSATRNLRQSSLDTALLQATFSYESEDAVDTSAELIFVEFSRIYDAYVNELRNMLGEECLNV